MFFFPLFHLLAALIIMLILYYVLWIIGPFRELTQPISTLQNIACWFITLYTPAMFTILIIIWPRFDNITDLTFIYTFFHGILGLMSMVTTRHFLKYWWPMAFLMFINGTITTFHVYAVIISAIILW